jgi:CRISPR-associated protein Csx10
MLTLKFEIRLDSNYHVGAGYGKGFNLDSALLRESDGTPVLRGSALSGLLRDGAYRLLKLPPLKKYSSEESTDEILKRLFGSPKQAKRWRISSARPGEKILDDAQSIHRVRIDPRTRRAESGKLFSQEEGVSGHAFLFTITCPNRGKAELDDAAILIAAVRFVRQFGRSRNRGLGECSIHLIDAIGIDDAQTPTNWEKWFLDRFDQVWLRGNPTDIVEAVIKSDIKAIDVPTGSGLCIRMIVRLDEPLLVAQRAESGNQFDTRTLIPGSTLLGALAGMAAERCNLADQADYRNFVALFLRGGITFPMLYPAYYDSGSIYPSIPAPLDLKTCSIVPFEGDKKGHGVYHAEKDEKCQDPECCSRLEPLDGFLLLRRLPPFTLCPQRSSELHIRIDEKTKRSKKGVLFGYSALSSGQYFTGDDRYQRERTIDLAARQGTMEGLWPGYDMAGAI